MKDFITKILTTLEKDGYITKNEHLTWEGLAILFMDEFKKISAKDLIKFLLTL